MFCALRIKIFIPLLFCLTFTIHKTALSQNTDSTFQNSFYALLDFDIDRADTLVQSLNNSSERAYLSHYKLFLNQILKNQIPVDYDAQLKTLTDSLDFYNKSEKRTLAFLSEIYLQRGIMEYSIDNQNTAIFSFFKAYRYWQRSKKENPDLILNLKLKGIFNLLMSNMPQPYKKWAKWIGYGGHSETGYIALKTYLSTTKLNTGTHQEAIIYLAFSYLKFNVEPSEIVSLIKEFSNKKLTSVTKFVLTRCAFKVRNPNLSQQWLYDSNDYTYSPQLYLKGKYEIYNLNEDGKNTLLGFIDRAKSPLFIADAHRYVSWQYFLDGDTIQYRKHQNQIEQLNIYPTWEDKQAKYESTIKTLPNKTLLRARLLFDAGKYQDALDSLTINQTKIKTRSQSIEFQYRLGRCYQMTKQNKKAIFHYSEAVKLGNLNTRYYAPYAALYTAELYSKENPITAKFYLDEAKRLNNGEHKNSIQQKLESLNLLLNQ